MSTAPLAATELPAGVAYFDATTETAPRERLQEIQWEKLGRVLAVAGRDSRFYAAKWRAAGLADPREVRGWDDFRRLPLTTKAELIADQAANPPYGSNLTRPLTDYIRLHQTSGTTGRPLKWLDTAESWDWWGRCWGHVYRATGVGPGDRVFFAFSFGPFIGFWSALEGARKVGAMAIPGGGQDSLARLHAIFEHNPTVLVCTPSYALRLAEVAQENGILNLRDSQIRVTIHAGEPGAAIESTRRRIEEAWGARCYDHTGLTEVGATGFECVAQNGTHLIESEFIFEVLNSETGEPVPPGTDGELVVTNLGRLGMPIIRYRTGDRVRLRVDRCACGRSFARLEGGIIGRIDDMITVRGVNVFPSAVEGIVRRHPQVVEFLMEVNRVRELDELTVHLEPAADLSPEAAERVARAVAAEIHHQLLIRAQVKLAPPGSLPRHEMKSRRLIRRKGEEDR